MNVDDGYHKASGLDECFVMSVWPNHTFSGPVINSISAVVDRFVDRCAGSPRPQYRRRVDSRARSRLEDGNRRTGVLVFALSFALALAFALAISLGLDLLKGVGAIALG